MARERAQMQADNTIEQCLDVQFAISRLIADATSLDDAMRAILEALGKGFHWRLTTLWLWDAPARQLPYQTSWPATTSQEHDAVVLATRLAERVRQSGEPIWLTDLAHDWTLFDAPKASHPLLRWAGAFPIRSHGESLGVISYFYHAMVVLEAPVTRTLTAIGNMLGPFIANMQTAYASQVSEKRHESSATGDLPLGVGETAAIFEALVDSVTVYDKTGSLVRANTAARELFRIDAAASARLARPYVERTDAYMLADEWGQPLPLDQWPLQRLLSGESLIGANMADVILTTASGQTLHLSVSGAPLIDGQRLISGAVMITRDVGVRRKLERQTHATLHALLEMAKTLVQSSEIDMQDDNQSNEQPLVIAKVRQIAAHMAEVTRRVLECRHVGIMAVDPETDMLYPMAVAGLTIEQERRWWQQYPLAAPLDSAVNRADVQRFRAGEPVRIDMTQPPFRDLPNTFAAASVLVTAMKIGERIVGVLVLDDGAESHHPVSGELELVEAVAKLATLVLERERLLSERETARANELALGEANRRMDEFLSIASHELKTPLTSVKGYIQLATHRLKRTLITSTDDMDRTQVDQSLQGAIDLLLRSDYYSDVLNRLVTELLDVARIQANTIEVHRASCDLVAIATEAVHMQRLALPERDIRLEIAANFAAIIFADAARIGQVITNLLANALNYSAAECGVTITMHRDESRITIAVRDEGPGIAVDEQQHIWERFYRGADQREYVGSGGLGIGLYISRKIIELHAGQIRVSSTVGAGSTFWFSLPLDGAPSLETC